MGRGVVMFDFIAFIGLFLGGIFVATKQAGGALPPSSDVSISYTPTQVNAYDLDTMARTIWGEAWIDGYKGMQAVANVIMNRYELAKSSGAYARRWGNTPAAICKKPYQFSVWNANDPSLERILNVTEANREFRDALQIAELALTGKLKDITGGADHYHANYVDPFWVSSMAKKTTTIQTHLFYKERV